MTHVTQTPGELWLVYDGECPICNNYCTFIRLHNTVGTLHLVDARKPGDIMEEITNAGLDIDQGMVVKFKDRLYYGADAIHILTLLSTRSDMLNRINYFLFSTRLGARVLYPAGKAVRNLVLKLLGIRYIDNLGRPPKSLVASKAAS